MENGINNSSNVNRSPVLSRYGPGFLYYTLMVTNYWYLMVNNGC